MADVQCPAKIKDDGAAILQDAAGSAFALRGLM